MEVVSADALLNWETSGLQEAAAFLDKEADDALVGPIYIAEIAPASLRGRLVTFYQLAIVSGLLLAYLSNYLLLNAGINNWRWMFSSQKIPMDPRAGEWKEALIAESR